MRFTTEEEARRFIKWELETFFQPLLVKCYTKGHISLDFVTNEGAAEGTAAVSMLLGTQDVRVRIAVSLPILERCWGCIETTLVHEVAHAVWTLKKMEKAGNYQQMMKAVEADDHHDDYWGACYAIVHRHLEECISQHQATICQFATEE